MYISEEGSTDNGDFHLNHMQVLATDTQGNCLIWNMQSSGYRLDKNTVLDRASKEGLRFVSSNCSSGMGSPQVIANDEAHKMVAEYSQKYALNIAKQAKTLFIEIHPNDLPHTSPQYVEISVTPALVARIESASLAVQACGGSNIELPTQGVTIWHPEIPFSDIESLRVSVDNFYAQIHHSGQCDSSSTLVETVAVPLLFLKSILNNPSNVSTYGFKGPNDSAFHAMVLEMLEQSEEAAIFEKMREKITGRNTDDDLIEIAEIISKDAGFNLSRAMEIANEINSAKYNALNGVTPPWA